MQLKFYKKYANFTKSIEFGKITFIPLQNLGKLEKKGFI